MNRCDEVHSSGTQVLQNVSMVFFCIFVILHHANLVRDTFASLVSVCPAGMNVRYEEYATFIQKLVLCCGETLPKINQAMFNGPVGCNQEPSKALEQPW